MVTKLSYKMCCSSEFSDDIRIPAYGTERLSY